MNSALRLVLMAVALMPLAGAEGPAGGLALSPGVFLVQGIPLGQDVDLGAVAPSTRIVVLNRADHARTFRLVIGTPADGSIKEWERGYEPLPDSAWIAVSRQVIEVPAKGQAEAHVITKLPSDQRLAGRRFIASFTLTDAGASGPISMALGGRVLLETAGSRKAGTAPGLDPAAVALEGVKPGAAAKAVVEVANPGDQPITYRLLPITAAVENRDTYDRYVTGGCTAVVDQRWLALPATITVPARGSAKLELAATVPAGTAAGRYEELVFLDPAAGAPGANQRDTTGQSAFIRVRFDVIAP